MADNQTNQTERVLSDSEYRCRLSTLVTKTSKSSVGLDPARDPSFGLLFMTVMEHNGWENHIVRKEAVGRCPYRS